MSMSGIQTDALTEIINVGVGRAALSLNELLGEHIELSVPKAAVMSPEAVSQQLIANQEPLDTTVVQDFQGSVRGRAMLAFPQTSAVRLGRIVGDRGDASDEELNIDLCGIVEEVGNIVLNNVLGTIANYIAGQLEFSIPEIWTDVDFQRMTASLSIDSRDQIQVVYADTRFSVSDRQITGSLILVLHVDEMQRIVNTMLSQTPLI
jgi:chemotaxis protein CheC